MIASAVLLGGLAIPAYSLASNGTMGDRLIAQLMLAIGAVTANVVTAVLLCEVFLTGFAAQHPPSLTMSVMRSSAA